MKRIEFAKTIELFIFIGLSGLCLYYVILGSNVYHQIADSRELQLLCLLLWATLFSGFLFIFLDFSLFSKQKSDFNALDYAVHSDTLANIANRQGIDAIIDKYVDEPLPENFGCSMFLLTSLNEINRTSRSEGNAQIKQFSIILKLASTELCFVGRNGGNVFMALFEDSTQEKIDTFMSRIEEKVIEYNHKKDTSPMYYQYGLAFHEDPHPESINALISLSSKRAHDADTTPVGAKKLAARRASGLRLVENKNEIVVESKVTDKVEPKATKTTETEIKETETTETETSETEIKEVKEESTEVISEVISIEDVKSSDKVKARENNNNIEESEFKEDDLIEEDNTIEEINDTEENNSIEEINNIEENNSIEETFTKEENNSIEEIITKEEDNAVEEASTKEEKSEPKASEVIDYKYTDEELFGTRDQSFLDYYREAI